MVTEIAFKPRNGWLALACLIALFAGGVTAIVVGAGSKAGLVAILGVGAVTGAFVACFGFLAIAPNEARVLLLFGEYKGTVRDSGFFWVNPFFSKKRISLRVRNFETGSTLSPERRSDAGKVVQAASRTSGKPSKVNDRDGNPIEISAVVVWKVVDTVEALFEVDDFEHFVAVQSEAALRSLASRHPYDGSGATISLRGNADDVCHQLKDDIQARLTKAGIEVGEARISHLAYAQEIAAAMLQRQQAQAIVDARATLVDGAVGMVQDALDKLAEKEVVELDEERRAAMVSNLLVVLCGSSHAQPVVNTGSLYT